MKEYYVRQSTYVVDAEKERERTRVWKDMHYSPSEDSLERGKKLTRCIETGKVYESAAAAARSIGCSNSSVKNAIHYGQSLKGLHWEYIEPGEKINEEDLVKEPATKSTKRGRPSKLPVKIKDMTPEQLKEYRRNSYLKRKMKQSKKDERTLLQKIFDLIKDELKKKIKVKSKKVKSKKVNRNNKYYKSYYKKQRERTRKYNNRPCMYKGKKITFCALKCRLKQEGFTNPTIEAKKYLIGDING